MKVVYFHRKPWPGRNFSIESQFNYLRMNLPPDIRPKVKVMRYFSKGILPRIFILFEAAFNQGDVNHITGDINFIALLLRKKRTVLTIHDLGFLSHPNRFSKIILKFLWLKLPVWRSEIITAVSERTKSELLKHITIDPSKVHVIHVPLSSHFTSVPKIFNKVEPVILQIGTKYNKNINRLLLALNGLSCRLELIGQPDEKLLNQLESSGVKYKISLNLSDEEIRNKYIEADIVSFVSTNEGFGMPIVEANAVGRVVVTSNISSMPEVAGNAAHLVDPFDIESIRNGIKRIIDDDSYREELINNGYKNCSRFHIAGIAEQYVQIYHALKR
ncbi:MAG TPA: glycosyltransferase family 1 protein [Saprospiraceae bacterium]|nr:glycosyltransferase family 1 protein [Saprospiraceae bacterium]